MFQPVGGMDRIAMAFAEKLGPVVRLGSEVTAIRRTGNGASVAFVDKRTGSRQSIEAAYCIVTIPLKVLHDIDCDVSSAHRAAIADVDYGNAVKIAWQSRRFWETDENIYGGISWVKGPTDLVWYPSDRFFSSKGILLGAYAGRADADELAARPLQEQFELSRAAIEACIPAAAASSKSRWRWPGRRCPTASASPRARHPARRAPTRCSTKRTARSTSLAST